MKETCIVEVAFACWVGRKEGKMISPEIKEGLRWNDEEETRDDTNDNYLKFEDTVSGIYINKNSYVRAGEQSLDSYYRPYHIVEYYRYIRFYADGTALLCTTTDEPSSVLPMLRRKEETSMVLRGHFRLFEDSVTIVATRLQKSVSEPRNRRRNKQTSVQEQVFQMELRLKSSGKRKNNQLQLVNYSYTINNKSTGRTTTNQIDVQSFKPFVFSRVKSFHIVSQAPL